MKRYNHYFPHDSNAKDDPKCLMLIDQLGLEGYGIYWVLVETLREQENYRYPLKMIAPLAKRYGTSSEKMQTVINNYELFETDEEDFFFSKSLRERMRAIDGRVEQARMAGMASAEKRRNKAVENERANNNRSTDVQRTFNDSPTNKIKENKLNLSIDTNVSSSSCDDHQLRETEVMAIIKEKFNEAVNGRAIRKIKGINGKRADYVRARLKEYGIEDFLKTIEYASSNEFLNGRNAHGWIMTFDWMVKPSNYAKVSEQNYNSSTNGNNSTSYKEQRISNNGCKADDFFEAGQ